MILADLKYNSENKSIFVDVPRSSIVLYPKTEEEYNTLKETIQSQLGEDVEVCISQKHTPSASVIFLCDDIEFRKSLFEKVGVELADNRKNFTLYKLKKDATRLDFEFNFTTIEEREKIIAIIRDCISGVHGIKLNFEKSNDKGVTTWSLTKDKSLKLELEQKLQSEYREENASIL